MAQHRAVKEHHTGRNILVAGTTGALAIVGFGGVASAEPAHDWTEVAECESSGDWNINTGNGYYGGLQFSQSTWDAYKPAGAPARADQASVEQQIQAAEATLAVQGVGAWPVCGQYLIAGAESDSEALSAPVGTSPTCDRVWPLDAPLSQGYHGGHNGIDLAAPTGTPIEAATSGTISTAGFDNDPGGYGNYIAQEADTGESIEYGHVSEIYVAPGDYVEAGEVIGAVGNAGSSTGPHLHLRVSTGDPLNYLAGACDTGATMNETPIYDEIQAEVDNAPTPIFDSVVADQDWVPIFEANRDVIEDPDLIYPGEILDVNGTDYTVVSGDTLSGIAYKIG